MTREELIEEIQRNGIENVYEKELGRKTRYELESMYYAFLSPAEDPHFSFSQINMYQRCGLQYFYRYIMGIRLPPNGGIVRGHSLHKTWAIEGEDRIKTGKQFSIEDKKEIFHNSFEEESEKAAFDEEEPKEECLNSGMSIIPVHHKATEQEIPIAIEESYENFIDGRKIVGVIDKITSEGVLDMKIKGKKMSDQEQYGMQLPVYTWLSGINDVGYDVFTATKTPKFQPLRRSITDQEVKATVKKMELVIDAIEKKVFIPCDPSGWQCSKSWCGYYDMCNEEIIR